MSTARWLMVVAGAALTAALSTALAFNLAGAGREIPAIRAVYSVTDPQFERTMGSLLGPPVLGGNRALELLNGDEIFPAMLTAIRRAKQSVCFETYIYWSGRVGREFAQALGDRARDGVRVHLLVDWVGSGKMEEHLLAEMREAGVEIQVYRPLRWYNLDRMNNRTHRKLLVVDGAIGFTGGVGVADHWLGDASGPEEWRDSQFRLEGPAVAQMQGAFMDNWMQSRGEVLHGEAYFPPLVPTGSARAQVYKSSPEEGGESIRLMYMLAIAASRKSIFISNSYFLPDDIIVEMLAAASRRGVAVEIVVPGPDMDRGVVRKASRSRWGPLLQAGVAIFEYRPTMYHCKVMIVDEAWVSVGSTNFDSRSFTLNDEANLNVLDEDFARRQVEVFEADKARSRRVTFEAWKGRPWREKIVEKAAAFFRGQL